GAGDRQTLGTSPAQDPPGPRPGGRRGENAGEGQAPPHWLSKRNGPLAMVQPEPDRTPPKVSRPPPSAGRCTPCRARRRAPGAGCGSPAGPAPAPAPAKQRTTAYESARDKGRTLGTLSRRVLPRTSARWTTTLHEAQPAHSSGML